MNWSSYLLTVQALCSPKACFNFAVPTPSRTSNSEHPITYQPLEATPHCDGRAAWGGEKRSHTQKCAPQCGGEARFPEAERHWMARWREGHGDAGMSAVSPSSEAGENLAFYKAFNITKHPKERTCPNHQARMGQAPSNLFPNRTCTHYTHHRVNTDYFGGFLLQTPRNSQKGQLLRTVPRRGQSFWVSAKVSD